METIDDIRREEGNPRSGPVGGKPRSIFSFFSEYTAPRLIALLLIAIGLLALTAGAMLFIAPLMIAGLALLIAASLAYLYAKPTSD